jgi:hypothetical protein
MIAHVAADGENRGRVILHIGHGRVSTAALDAAFLVAKAFDAAVECLFVEDQQLYDMARLPFTREISRCGRSIVTAEADTLALDFRCDAIAAQRQITARTASTGVVQFGRIMRDTPVDALARACAEHGPWNAIALIDSTVMAGDTSLAYAALTNISGHTGVISVGLNMPTKKSVTERSTVALVDAIEDLLVLLRIAERLSSALPDDTLNIVLLIAVPADGAGAGYGGLEAQARLALAARDQGSNSESAGSRGQVKIQTMAQGADLNQALTALNAGFLIAYFGCSFFPFEKDPTEQLVKLPCPSFIVR